LEDWASGTLDVNEPDGGFKLTLAFELTLKESRPYQSVQPRASEILSVYAQCEAAEPVLEPGRRRRRKRQETDARGGKESGRNWSKISGRAERVNKKLLDLKKRRFSPSDARSLKGRKEENDASVHTHALSRSLSLTRTHTHKSRHVNRGTGGGGEGCRCLQGRQKTSE